MTVPPPVGIALVGLGGVAERHGRALASSSQLRLVAGFDVSPEQSARFARRFPSVPIAADLDRLLSNREVEAVMVLTPPDRHAELATAALTARKHVFVEKPIALRSADASKLAVLAERVERVLQVGHVTRFDDELIELRRRIVASDLGAIARIRAISVSRTIPTGMSWHTDARVAGGGVLMDLGIHAVDAINYVLGDVPLRSVFATTRTMLGSYAVEDMAVATLIFTNGTVAQLEAGFGITEAIGGSSATIEVFGTAGYARTRPFMAEIGGRKASVSSACVSQDGSRAGDPLFERQALHFAECCRFREPCAAGADVGLAALAAVEAMYRSARLGEVVEMERLGRQKPGKVLQDLGTVRSTERKT